MKLVRLSAAARPVPPDARLIFTVFAAGAALVLCGCEKAEPPAPPAPEVEVTAVEQRDVPIYREAVGTMEGDVNASISAQVTGYLLSRGYVEGSYVTNGQVLFQIDPAPFTAALDQATSKMAEASAAQEKYALMVKRYTPLAATEAISQQELDDAVQNEKAAAAQVQAAQAAVEQSQLNLGFTTIRAPVDGMSGLASSQAQVGNLVGPSSGQLTTVTTVDPIRVYFSVAQQIITEIQQRMLAEGQTPGQGEGAPLELILAGGWTYPEKGRIKFRDNQVDVRTGTVTLVGEFSNPQRLLVPGMFVRIRALLRTDKDALLVPQRAVTEMQGRYLVAVVNEDNKISIRPVNTGERVGEEWVITGNIKAGDKVVAEGIQKVRDGAEVNPVPFAEKQAATMTSPPAEEEKKQ
jgi:membrane fusion protein, multidrug efflux system